MLIFFSCLFKIFLKKTSHLSNTFWLTNIGSNMHRFRATAIWNFHFSNGTPCTLASNVESRFVGNTELFCCPWKRLQSLTLPQSFTCIFNAICWQHYHCTLLVTSDLTIFLWLFSFNVNLSSIFIVQSTRHKYVRQFEKSLDPEKKIFKWLLLSH